MDQKQIEDLVQMVLSQIQHSKAPVAASNVAPSNLTMPASQPSNVASSVDEGILPDLGDISFKQWIGVQKPFKREVLVELQKSTGSRVCAGRVGTRLRTTSYLRFLADHARSKDTVLQEIPKEWVSKTGLFEVQTQVVDKNQYLTRPDLGRRLSASALEALEKNCKKNVDVQVIVSDGLSTEALTANYDEILPPLIKGLENARLNVGTPFFIRYGRVKVEDQVGEILGAKVVILLIGERPGLGQSESMSCYMIYAPNTTTTVEADRTCISNIHRAGTPPVEAAAVIVDLAQKMLKHQASGVNLNK